MRPHPKEKHSSVTQCWLLSPSQGGLTSSRRKAEEDQWGSFSRFKISKQRAEGTLQPYSRHSAGLLPDPEAEAKALLQCYLTAHH